MYPKERPHEPVRFSSLPWLVVGLLIKRYSFYTTQVWIGLCLSGQPLGIGAACPSKDLAALRVFVAA